MSSNVQVELFNYFTSAAIFESTIDP